MKLAFFSHALEGFGLTLDPVLAIVAFRRQQPDHLIGSRGGRTRHVASGEIDRVTHDKFVLHTLLHHAKR